MSQKPIESSAFCSDTFYRYKELVDEDRIENLVEKTRKKPDLKNRIDKELEKTVVQIAIDFPAYGQTPASNE